LSTRGQDNVPDEIVLGRGHFSAVLYDYLVSSPGIVLLIMAMEILSLGNPEPYFVVPVVTIDSDGDSLVHSALTYHSSIHLFAIRRQFNEAGPERMA